MVTMYELRKHNDGKLELVLNLDALRKEWREAQHPVLTRIQILDSIEKWYTKLMEQET